MNAIKLFAVGLIFSGTFLKVAEAVDRDFKAQFRNGEPASGTVDTASAMLKLTANEFAGEVSLQFENVRSIEVDMNRMATVIFSNDDKLTGKLSGSFQYSTKNNVITINLDQLKCLVNVDFAQELPACLLPDEVEVEDECENQCFPVLSW